MFRLYTVFITLACSLCAQPNRSYRIDTVAGTEPTDDGTAATAILNSPRTLAIGADGTIYVGSVVEGVRSITPGGRITMNGAGVVIDMEVDKDGTLWYLTGGPELCKQTANGEQKIFTPNPTFGPSRLPILTSIALDPDGNLVIADQENRRILRMTPAGVVSVMAGSGSLTRLDAPPNRVAVDRQNNIYIAGENRILRLPANGAPTVIAGNGQFGAPAIGSPATSSALGVITALAVNDSGEILLVDSLYHVILKIGTQGNLEAVLRDADASDLAFDSAGRLLFTDTIAGRVWRVNGDGSRTSIAGRIRFEGDGGPAIDALLKSPRAVAVHPDGTLFIGDTGNHRIRKVTRDGVISTVAGNGTPGVAGDGGPAAAAQVAGPDHLVIDGRGNIYFSTDSSQKVRRIRPDGIIETVAGTGEYGSSGDGGPATNATLQSVRGLAVDARGRLFISDYTANRVRVVETDGTIRTYAGTGERVRGGEGTPAVSSPIYDPSQITADTHGALTINEGTTILRRITPDGVMTTIGPTIPFGRPGDDGARQCIFSNLWGLAGLEHDTDGSLLVSGSNRICRLMPDGTSWQVAGTHFFGFSGDGGPAASATLWAPQRIAVDPKTETIYVADAGNHRVRRLQPDYPPGAFPKAPYIAAVIGAGASAAPVTRLSPGGLASVFGTDFAPPGTYVAVQSSDFVAGVLPTKLANTCVEVGGKRAFLTYAGTAQINFQVPDIPVDIDVSVQVVANCGTATDIRSAGWMVEARITAPEFLYWVHGTNGRSPVVAVDAITGAKIGPPGLIAGLAFRPAKPGDLLTIYCISLGPANPPVQAGAGASGEARITTALPVAIDGKPVPAENILYAGLSPDSPGLYQINLVLPALSDGDHPITIGDSPAEGFIRVGNP